MIKKSLLVFLIVMVMAPDAGAAMLNSSKLRRLGISSRPEAPNIAFEDFYKTSDIRAIEFAPDNGGVYFLKSDGKVENLFEYSLSENQMSQVTNYDGPVKGYLVDPKGRYLLVLRDNEGNELWNIYRYDLKSRKTKQLTKNKGAEQSYFCDIAKDGSGFYYVQTREGRSTSDIMYYDVKDGEKKVVKRGNDELLGCQRLNDEGTLLAFQRFVDNNENHIGIIDVETNKAWYVNDDKNVQNSNAVFHGDDLYYLSTKESNIRRMWRYDAKSKKVKKVNVGISRDIQSFNIYAEGRASAIAYRGKIVPKLQVYEGVFKKKKGFEKKVENDLMIVVYPKKTDEMYIAKIENSHTPSQTYLFEGDDRKLIYDSNKSGIGEEYFAKSYSTFIKSFDGLDIPTHFFIPNGTSRENKRPVIVWVHGGPESHVDPFYSPRVQYLVNKGYLLVAPNVRGSSGFGKEYMFMDNGDWGGGHIKDIVAITEYVKKLDFVDGENVFLIGGSFGGFSVLSLITQYPNVFDAAVDIFGPVEMATFVNSWPQRFQGYWFEELGGDPRKDDELNKRVSPIYHVDRVSIPLQIQQGANDIRVPIEQSDMMVGKLKQTGKDVEYLVYPDEGHGFRKFKNSRACYESVVKFFGKHMKRESIQ